MMRSTRVRGGGSMARHLIAVLAGGATSLLGAPGAGQTPAQAQTRSLSEGAVTIQMAVDAALATHPAVGVASATVESARAMESGALALRWPTIGGSMVVTSFAEPMVVAPFHEFDPTAPPAFDRTLLQSQLGAEYTVFDWGGRSAGIASAEAAAAAAESEARDTTMRILHGVVAAYTGVLRASVMQSAAERHLAAIQAELERAGRSYAEGAAAQVDVLRAEAALFDATARLTTARSRRSVAERDLARAMGIEPALLEGREFVDIRPGSSPGEDATAVDRPSQDGLAGNTTLEAARLRADAARRQADGERAARLPSLLLNAGVFTFGSAAGDHAVEWQAGLRVSWALFTGGRREAAIRQAEAQSRLAEESARLSEISLAGALDSDRAAATEAAARAVALDASVRQWEEIGRIEALALQEGTGVQTDFMQAEAALFNARAGLAAARYDEILALASLARSQGRLDRAWLDDNLEVVP